MLVIVDDEEIGEARRPIKGDSLQARFEAMRQRRIEAQKVTDANKALSKPKRLSLLMSYIKRGAENITLECLIQQRRAVCRMLLCISIAAIL